MPSDKLQKQVPSVPDYTLLKCIGEGSYGEVWLARSVTGQYRAVKVVHRQKFSDNRPFDREFSGIQSYEIVSASHPSLLRIMHVGINEVEGYFYYVMELADDQRKGPVIEPETYVPRTLASDLHHHHRLPASDCFQIGISLSAALQCLHENGKIHRDIKPSNVVFVGGVAKLADIGLVSGMGGLRSLVGTEGFIPPEGPGSKSADIYALGKVLYEISTGKDRLDYPEFPTDVDVMPDKDKWLLLNRIILRACDIEKHRYHTPGELCSHLMAISIGTKTGAGEGLGGWLKDKRVPALAAILCLVLLAVSAVVYRGRPVKASGQQEPSAELPAYVPATVSSSMTILSRLDPDIAWWVMERSPDPTLVRDVTGKGHDAEIGGSPQFSEDATIGQKYVQFDGRSYLQCRDSNDLDLVGDWTITLWARPKEPYKGWEFWVDKQGGEAQIGGYCICLDTRRRLPGVARMAVQNHGMDSLPGGIVGTGVWVHVAATYRQNSQEGCLYVDGILVGKMILRPMFAYTRSFLMGACHGSGGVVYRECRSKGALADVRVYGRTLSAADVRELAVLRHNLTLRQRFWDGNPNGFQTRLE